MKELNDKWMIEVLQASNTCPFAQMKGLKVICKHESIEKACAKDNCEIRVGVNR